MFRNYHVLWILVLFANNFFLIRVTEKSRQIRQMSELSAATVTVVAVTVTCSRRWLLGLPYVVEMCRNILAVLC